LQTSNYYIEAYDDGFFPVFYKGGRGTTVIAGVEVNSELVVSRLGITSVRVDQGASQRAIIEISKKFNGSIIILDGVTYAGFDVVDPRILASTTGKGVIVVFQYPLNLQRIKNALYEHFEDWKERYRVIEEVYSESMYYNTPWKPIRINITGISREEAFNVVKNTCIYSPIPEPLRIADKIASTIAKIKLRMYHM